MGCVRVAARGVQFIEHRCKGMKRDGRQSRGCLLHVDKQIAFEDVLALLIFLRRLIGFVL